MLNLSRRFYKKEYGLGQGGPGGPGAHGGNMGGKGGSSGGGGNGKKGKHGDSPGKMGGRVGTNNTGSGRGGRNPGVSSKGPISGKKHNSVFHKANEVLGGFFSNVASSVFGADTNMHGFDSKGTYGIGANSQYGREFMGRHPGARPGKGAYQNASDLGFRQGNPNASYNRQQAQAHRTSIGGKVMGMLTGRVAGKLGGTVGGKLGYAVGGPIGGIIGSIVGGYGLKKGVEGVLGKNEGIRGISGPISNTKSSGKLASKANNKGLDFSKGNTANTMYNKTGNEKTEYEEELLGLDGPIKPKKVVTPQKQRYKPTRIF